MIIYLRKGANRIMAEYVTVAFQRQGFDVHIKNGDGKFILAVIGPGKVTTEGILHIDRIKSDDELFVSSRQEFVDAREYFRD